MNGRPSATPASNTRTTLGCSIDAAAAPSRSKRARACVSPASLITFTAQRRPAAVSSASYTVPIPPRAIRRSRW